MSVYVWGSNKCQQLIGQKGLHCYAPAIVSDQFDGQTPIQVASGDGHTLVLCESGDIYSFGRGKEGQLGHDSAEISTSTSSHSHVVAGLEHETVIKIAAGSLTSYAITSAGEVYHWGLIHRHVHEYKETGDSVNEAVQAGKLTGIAQEQLSTVVEVDTDARAHASSAASSNRRGGGRPVQSRQLRDIVRDSTERWMMPTDDAEQEYLEELRAMGYQNEDVEERMQSRGREYHGMLAMGCSRQIQTIPRLISGLNNVRIVEVSAGYAHVMLLSGEGRLYAAGYNDRGQLGLGHRINTSEFKHVDFLANKFVVQVVCGQQHTLCRVVDRPGSNNSGSSSSSSAASVDLSTVFVGSGVGADAYVWGNGILGQLGIGRRGTSKGRLLPTLLASLHERYPRGVIDVAAGSNFSAVVTIDGSVYSFGHAEYNQHGTGNKSYKDYVDPYYYFEPRVMECFDNTAKLYSCNITRPVAAAVAPIRMRSLSCGAVFTVGLDEAGNLHSWGWNDSGVLGHGFNHFSSSAMQITSIGKSFDGCRVLSVSAGSKHVIVLTQTQGNPWALTFKSLLEAAPYADLQLHVDGGSGVSYPCHRSVLSCRSKYFQGFIHAAEMEAQEDRLYRKLLRDREGDAAAQAELKQLDEEQGEGGNSSSMLHITLHSQYANASTVRSLLEYLYLDRIHIPFHKRRELLHLAEDLNITRLVTALEADFAASAAKQPSTAASSATAATAATPEAGATQPHTGSPSFFINDLAHLFNSTSYCDVIFVDGPIIPHPNKEDDEDNKGGSLPVFRKEDHCFALFAHKVIVSRIPYFEALISGHFSESSNFVTLADEEHGWERVTRTALCVDVSGLQMDEISLETFVAVIRYAYTGRLTELPEGCDGQDPEDVDMGLVMAALVAANRLNFTLLTQHCERVLSLHIGEHYPHNAENCLSFAVSYNFPRLERQCLKVLKRDR